MNSAVMGGAELYRTDECTWRRWRRALTARIASISFVLDVDDRDVNNTLRGEQECIVSLQLSTSSSELFVDSIQRVHGRVPLGNTPPKRAPNASSPHRPLVQTATPAEHDSALHDFPSMYPSV